MNTHVDVLQMETQSQTGKGNSLFSEVQFNLRDSLYSVTCTLFKKTTAVQIHVQDLKTLDLKLYEALLIFMMQTYPPWGEKIINFIFLKQI